VILCGDELGTRAVSVELGTEWIPNIARNEIGTPLLSSVFQLAQERAACRVLCYVNTDIVLLQDFLATVRRLTRLRRRFLMIGQRWDVDVTEELPLDLESWESNWRRLVEKTGTLHPPVGSDYFVYVRGTLGQLPDFAVGRPVWDNWMIYRARAKRVPVIDATDSAVVIHQNHDYSHVPNGDGRTYEGPEAMRNRALLGSDDRLFTLTEATHRLTTTGLRPVLGWTGDDMTRRLEVERVISAPLLKTPLRALSVLWRAARSAMGSRRA
jgi:hypothetical protein